MEVPALLRTVHMPTIATALAHKSYHWAAAGGPSTVTVTVHPDGSVQVYIN